MSHLSHRPSKPAYYIEDCRISNTPTALLRVWNQSLIVQKNTTDYDLAKEVQKTAQEQQILQMTFKQAME